MQQRQTDTELTAQPLAPTKVDRFLRGAGLNVLLVVASGVFASFLFPPREVWWFGWVYLLPLLIALRRTTTVRAAGWLMVLFGLAFFTSTLSWLNAIFGISVVGIFVLASLPWVLFGLAYRVLVASTARWHSSLLAGAAVALLTPVFWLAVEWIRCEGWYFQFSWAQFGFAFTSCRRGGVLYPYLGVYGVTFGLMLVNAIMVEILLAKTRWPGKLAGVAALAAALIPLSLYLNAPVGIADVPGELTRPFRVEVVQNEMGSLRQLKADTLSLAALKPQLIVWPEYALMDYPLDDPKLLAELQDVARTMHCTLILGCKNHVPHNTRVDWLRRRAMESMEGALYGNIALVIGPDGQVLGTYQKTHPIQFFSDGVPGRSYPTFATEVGRVGIGICYDFDFASCPRRLVQNGAEVLVVPTFDAGEWTEVQHVQHARMAQARAAESGRWVVRATSSGVSQLISPSGFVTAVIWNGEIDATMGIASPQQKITPYVRWTYRLPYVCLAVMLLWGMGMLLAVGIRWYNRRRRKSILGQ